MSIRFNHYLRMYRKRSQLTQSDIAFIMGLPEYTNISHWEKGRRTPNTEMILLYHLLFDVPVETLFNGQKDILSESVVERIESLITNLNQMESSPKIARRIAFLESTLKRLKS